MCFIHLFCYNDDWSNSLEATYIKKKLGGISVLEAFSLAKTHKKTLSNDTRGVTTWRSYILAILVKKMCEIHVKFPKKNKNYFFIENYSKWTELDFVNSFGLNK